MVMEVNNNAAPRTILCQYQTTVEAFDEKIQKKKLSRIYVILISSFYICVCADGFQGLLKAFHCPFH
jgi:hypothetical protein